MTVTAIPKHENPWPLEGLNISEGNLLESFYRIHRSEDRRHYLRPCGLYVADPCIFDFLGKDGYLDLKEQLIPRLKKSRLPVYVQKIEGFYSNINSIEDYYQIHRDLLNAPDNGSEYMGKLKEISESIWMGENSHISPRSKLIGPVVIGGNCEVEEDSLIIGPTVIGNDCHISEGVMIRESIIWDHSTFHAGSRVETSIIANGSPVKGNTVVRNLVVSSDGYNVRLPWHFGPLTFKKRTKREAAFSFF
jgi:NDP-sugar pyrophosphorylase family protein